MTREERLRWCKDRALEYADRGDLAGALASLTSDLRKHPETAPSAAIAASAIGVFEVTNGTPASMRRFIEGFN